MGIQLRILFYICIRKIEYRYKDYERFCLYDFVSLCRVISAFDNPVFSNAITSIIHNQINVFNWSTNKARSLVHALSNKYACDRSRTLSEAENCREQQRKKKKRERERERERERKPKHRRQR